MNILIVDNNIPSRERLSSIINDMTHYHLLDVNISSDIDILSLIERIQPDIIFLEIELFDQSDGIKVAIKLALSDRSPIIIFCTSCVDSAINAFNNTYAIDYLVKPVSSRAVANSLRKAVYLKCLQASFERIYLLGDDRSHRMSFCIKTHNGIERIHLKQVLYFAAKHKHVTLYYKWGAVLLNDTLVALEKEFGHYLLRIHRNTLVVRHRLLRLENQPTGAICVYLKDCSDALLVSRRHAPLVRRAMQ